jgi:hypothetical protein
MTTITTEDVLTLHLSAKESEMEITGKLTRIPSREEMVKHYITEPRVVRSAVEQITPRTLM